MLYSKGVGSLIFICPLDERDASEYILKISYVFLGCQKMKAKRNDRNWTHTHAAAIAAGYICIWETDMLDRYVTDFIRFCHLRVIIRANIRLVAQKEGHQSSG